MGDQHGLGALHVRVTGHDGIAGFTSLCQESLGPRDQSFHDLLDLGADIKAQVSRDLLVAGATGVQLATEIADAVHERQLNEVVDVFGDEMIADAWSAAMASNATRICAPSSLLRMFAAVRAAACALLAAISCRRSRQSKTMERCHCSNSGSSGSRKRPDHILPDCFSFDIG
jgi:hypothetical protein